MDQNTRDIRALIDELNRYTKAYDEGHPKISDKAWDDLYFKLVDLEERTGVIYPDSPTRKIYYENVNSLEKVQHQYQPMLSLDKTKEPDVIQSFVKGQDWFAMFKMDGLSCRLTYVNGRLIKAETRGNGEIGEDVTHNAYVISNIPEYIPAKDREIIIDGEIICAKLDFEKFKDEYKNPRNFAAGSIRLLDAKECASRKLRFIAWDLVKGCEDIDFTFWRLEKLDDWGFETVPRVGDAETVDDAIDLLNNDSYHDIYPIDGYVFKFESRKYGKSLGRTEHHWNDAIAYKFYDEEYETELIDIEWSMSRTGTLTPVAIFKPIDIDGSTVERANLHNLSVMRDTLGLYPEKNQKVWVAKMNMIIPQITRAAKNDDHHDHVLDNGYITKCPICGKETKVVISESGTQNVVCTNKSCEGKLANRIDHYLGKKGLDVKGISMATIEKLIDWGWINELGDIYKLDGHRAEWISKEGFGEASVGKILNAINASRSGVSLQNFISAIGIPLVGKTIAKELTKYFESYQDFRDYIDTDDCFFDEFDGIGTEINNSLKDFDYTEFDDIAFQFLTFAETQSGDLEAAPAIKDKTFVITGKVSHFKNRDELKAEIESLGGKVAGSVSSKTDYLINNDSTSTSSKNKKAQELGIPIITEEEYLKMKS